MNRLFASLASVAVLSSSTMAGAATFDAFASFNGSNPAGGFTYFGYSGPNAAGLHQMAPGTCDLDVTCVESNIDDSGFYKAGPQTPPSIVGDDSSVITIPQDQLIVSPGDFGASVSFVAGVSSFYRISASFNGIESLNNGIGIFRFRGAPLSVLPVITFNSVPVNKTYTEKLYLNAGQFAGFFFSPGRNASHDATSFTYSITSVPEPSAWALMIGGFGLAGSAIRRRRAASA